MNVADTVACDWKEQQRMEFRGSEINQGVFWRAVGTRPVGATIVTAEHEGHKAGFLGLSFAHVSADPPLVLVSAGHSTSALATILASKAFAVSVLPARSEDIARAFGGGVPSEKRFSLGAWRTIVTGSPSLVDAPVTFDCELHRAIDEGKTSILLGRVVGVAFAEATVAALAYRGDFRDLV
jgi:flavin reductase (DIM6/NTAB) family NADH-FMN oxidoreductase RutF